MAKTYITDITHFLNDAGELADMPAPARKMASFLVLIIDAVTKIHPTRDHDIGIRCRKRGCKGSVRASLLAYDEEIGWYCPSCLECGVIRNWQGAKWDQTAGDGEPGAERGEAGEKASSKPRSGYTRKEGQYLAFIYYYTKLNRQAPAELDMQRHFRVSPPAVHDMIVRLDKRGFISREPGKARSIRLLLNRDQLPDLE